jgi:hypothetical protein
VSTASKACGQTARDASLSVRRKEIWHTILAQWARSIGQPVADGAQSHA